MTFFLHEQIYRDLRPAAGRLVTVCGAGALGANMAESLARMGLRELRLIDRDRVVAHNLSTQPWTTQDVGAGKARTLAAMLHRAVGARVDARQVELDQTNAAKLLAGSALIVDAFDNPPSRLVVAQAAATLAVPCLHLALARGGDYGCGLWDERYVLGTAFERRDQEVCDYPLTRPLALLTAAAGAEIAVRFLIDGTRQGFELTLRDLRLLPT